MCVCLCVCVSVCVCVERERETTIPKPHGRDFLGGQLVENLPSKAEDAGLITGPRTEIPQAMTAKPRATTRESKMKTKQTSW